MKTISNKAVYRLGKEIVKNNGEVTEAQLVMLQEFRTSFSQPLTTTFHQLRRITDKVDKDTIVAFRLKRIGTIINKLLRKQDRYLTTMGDIAGIRCIFKTKTDLEKALELIKSKFTIEEKIRNHYEDTKDIGYKGIHVYIKDHLSNKKIEIQLRTIKDHNWATLVEITDILYDLRLKEMGFKSDEKFARFHALMSSDKELTKDEANLVYDVLKQHNFITRLSNTFRKNNNEVKKRWSELNKTNSYFLLEASKNKIPTLMSFNNFKNAEEEYFKRYKENDTAEIVLTSIRKPNFRQITIAYANYILSYHNFINDIKPILKVMAQEAIEDREFRKFKNIFRTYESLQMNIILNTLLDSPDIFFQGSKKDEIEIRFGKKVSTYKKKQILEKLNKDLKKTNLEHQKFIEELKKIIPPGNFSNLKYKLFLKRHHKRMKRQFVKEKFDDAVIN